MRWLGLVISVLFLLGCPSRVEAPADAGMASDAGSSTDLEDGGAMTDAGVNLVAPPAAALRVVLTAILADGGAEVLAESDAAGRIEVDPAVALVLDADRRLKDYRVRLMDWTDRVTPSDDLMEVSDAGLHYRLGLAAPLEPGRRYTLVVDAEVGPEVTDEAGHPLDDVRVELHVRGEVAPPKAAPPTKKRKKR